jgi:type IV secretory pathway VirB10-like protein
MITDFLQRRPRPEPVVDVAPSPLRPAPPLAKRLNRNALTVAAVIMGMTVLTAVVVLSPGRQEGSAPPDEGGTDASPPIPSRPAFLDEPARVGSAGLDSAPAVELELHDFGSAPAMQSGMAGQMARSSGARDPQAWAGAADPYAPYAAADATPAAVTPSAREQAFQAALTSSVLAGAPQARSAAASQSDEGSFAMAEQQLLALGDSILRASVRPSGVGAHAPQLGSASGAGDAGTSGESRQRAFLDRAGDTGGSTVIARLEPAGSPYTLRAGTVIPGILVTGISSDLPGEIVGQVSRNVYDSRTQRALLIPKGARLIGTYDNQVAAGQGRLLVAWTRLILPDGRSMRLPGLALKDPAGQTGAKDKVDNHWRRVFGSALLLSAISAGVQLSQPQQASVLAPPSSGQVAAGALGQELSSVALEILRRGMDVAPTITIRAGHPFNVLLNGDLVFDGPYEEEPASAR